MLNRIVEKFRAGTGSDLVISTQTPDDRVLIDSSEIHAKGFGQCLKEFEAMLPAKSTINEDPPYLIMEDHDLLRKQGALLFHYIGSGGELPKGYDRGHVENILFGAAFKVKDVNGDSALTLACKELKDKTQYEGMLKSAYFALTSNNEFFKEVIGNLTKFGNADEVFLPDNARNVPVAILFAKHADHLIPPITTKSGVGHDHMLSINYFRPTDNVISGDLKLSSSFEEKLKKALQSLSDKQFMQYWAMRKDIMFSQRRTTSGFYFPPNSQFHHNDDGYGAIHTLKKRRTYTYTDLMEEELARRNISKETLRNYIESGECKTYLAAQKLLTAPEDPEAISAEPKDKKNLPSGSVNKVGDSQIRQLEGKSKTHENGHG